MSDNKKYYYLKLKDNFFESDEMIILENMQDGYLYSNILLKLYLRSLKNEGRLMFNDRIPFNSTMLAQVTRHSVGVIEKAMKVFKELGLIEVMDSGAIYMTDIQNFIGGSTTEADRKREYRRKIEKEKQGLLPDGQNNGQMSGQMSDKYPPEIEIEKELDTEKELESDKKKESVSRIFQCWNDKPFITHKDNAEIRSKIEKGLNKYSEADILTAINNYEKVYNSDFYYKHKWALTDFLKQSNGVPNFLEEGKVWENYKEHNSNSIIDGRKPV